MHYELPAGALSHCNSVNVGVDFNHKLGQYHAAFGVFSNDAASLKAIDINAHTLCMPIFIPHPFPSTNIDHDSLSDDGSEFPDAQ